MKSILVALSSLIIAGCHPEARAKVPEGSSAAPRTGAWLLTQRQPTAWYQPGDRPIFLADVLHHGSQSPMSVGFARYAAGASNDWTLSYDEVLVITKGEFSVLTGGRATTARAGEAIFLARGTPLTYRAEQDSELLYISYPHWEQATRASPHASALDEYHAVPPSVAGVK